MKKLISVMIIITMIMQCFVFSASARGESLLKGDVYKDYELNSLDVITLKKIVAGLDKYISSADINGDGRADAKDLLGLIRMIKGDTFSDKTPSLMIYDVDRKAFQAFLDEMTVETLRNSEGSYSAKRVSCPCDYQYTANCENLQTGEISVTNERGGVELAFVGSYAFGLGKTDIELASDPVKLKQIFAEYGIDLKGDPETVCIIRTSYWLPIVWIKCDGEDYFIETAQVYGEDYQISYEIRIYSSEAFVEYAKDIKATLIVDGVEVESENVIVNSQYCVVSMTEILRAIGATVDWKTEDHADITYNDKQFVMEKGTDYGWSANFYEVGNEVNNYFMLFGGTLVFEWSECDLIVEDYLAAHAVSALLNDGVYNYRFLTYDLETATVTIITSIVE